MMPGTMYPGHFAELLWGYTVTFSGSVTSWMRTVEHNAKVGGVEKSAHLYGVAADVVYDGSPPGPEADEWLRRRGLKRIREGDHDHIMPLVWNP
jgi:hypothetical protein